MCVQCVCVCVCVCACVWSYKTSLIALKKLHHLAYFQQISHICVRVHWLHSIESVCVCVCVCVRVCVCVCGVWPSVCLFSHKRCWRLRSAAPLFWLDESWNNIWTHYTHCFCSTQYIFCTVRTPHQHWMWDVYESTLYCIPQCNALTWMPYLNKTAFKKWKNCINSTDENWTLLAELHTTTTKWTTEWPS